MSLPVRFPAFLALTLLATATCASAQELGKLRDGFETGQTSWRLEETDTTVRLQHDRSDRAAREGRTSERFRLNAGAGSSFYVSYPLPKVRVEDDPRVSLFVRSNRSGMQLLGRVVLPADVDPENNQPTFVTIVGTMYESPERWRRLELTDIAAAVDEQARVIRAATNRPVSLEGAYLERLVVNLYGGPGDTEVFLDDLTVEPVPLDAEIAPSPTPAPDAPEGPAPDMAGLDDGPPDHDGPATGQRVELIRNRLKKDGQDWFFTSIEAPGADIDALRAAGFDVLEVRLDTDPEILRRAVAAGFMLMPRLEARPGDPDGPLDGSRALSAASSFPEKDAVAFWNLGESLGLDRDLATRKAERDRIRKISSELRRSREGFSRLSTGLVFGMFPDYARSPQNLDMIGTIPSGWGTVEEMVFAIRSLTTRRNLAIRGNAEQLFWSRVDIAPHETARLSIWGDDAPPAWGEPRIQPEQVRLYTYMALAAGYRGISYRADAELTRPSGRPMLLEMALLNEEIDLFEPLLARGPESIDMLDTFPPEPTQEASPGGLGGRRPERKAETGPHPFIKAASLTTRDRRGVLLVVAEFTGQGQFQPGQMAMNDLTIIVPAQESATAWEISPGGVKPLTRSTVPGGLKVVLPVFDTTALVLVTTDIALVRALEDAISRVRPRAVQMAIEQARLKYQWTAEINARLALLGQKAKDAEDLIHHSSEAIKLAQEKLDDMDYESAWSEARRASRPLRLLMRAQWDQSFLEMTRAIKYRRGDPDDRQVRAARLAKREIKPRIPLLQNTPVTCPTLLSFNTLEQHLEWVAQIRDGYFGANLLPSGSFEEPDTLETAGWSERGHRFEGVATSVRSVEGGVDGSRRAIRLAAGPAVKGGIDDLPPLLDQPAVAVVSPPIAVEARQFLRISVLVRIPRMMTPGGGGVIIRDSIGGEPLQFRTTNSLYDWHEVVLFRRVASNEPLTITLGLAGYGSVFFDDLRVQRLEDPSTSPARPSPDLAGTRSPTTLQAPDPNPTASLPTSSSPPRR